MKFLGITWHRHELYLLGVILTLAALLTALRLAEAPIGAVTDDAYYIEMARSIATGLGPVLNTGPDLPQVNPGIFPPGFPYLLSPVARLFPDSLSAFFTVPLLATLCLLPLCLWLPGPGTDNRLRLSLAAVVMVNPWVIAWSGRILSDNPYAALSLGALLLLARLDLSRVTPRGVMVAVLALSVAAISVRTIGWAVVLAITAVLTANRQWRWALGLPLATAALVWGLGGATLLTPAYTTQMLHHHGLPLWRFALANCLGYVAELPVILLPIFGQPAAAVCARFGVGALYPAAAFLTGALLLALAGLAISRRWRDRQLGPRVRLFTFYLVFYAGALAVFDGYPSGVQVRLLIPVLPVLAWLVLLGAGDLAGKLRCPLPNLVVTVMITAALVHNGWRIAHPLRTTVEANGHGLVDPGQGTGWLRSHTPPTTVIMTQDTLQKHIHLGRPVVALPAELTTANLTARVNQYGVKYILISPTVTDQPRRLDPTGQKLLQLVQAQPQHYQAVLEDPANALFIFACRSATPATDDGHTAGTAPRNSGTTTR